ncbi:unnamed protein product [Amoebophrya sp. A25]|nr:unnamed protein product [Amoebophrya sp. A25]|eukprot:GSA25T00005893001.1
MSVLANTCDTVAVVSMCSAASASRLGTSSSSMFDSGGVHALQQSTSSAPILLVISLASGAVVHGKFNPPALPGNYPSLQIYGDIDSDRRRARSTFVISVSAYDDYSDSNMASSTSSPSFGPGSTVNRMSIGRSSSSSTGATSTFGKVALTSSNGSVALYRCEANKMHLQPRKPTSPPSAVLRDDARPKFTLQYDFSTRVAGTRKSLLVLSESGPARMLLGGSDGVTFYDFPTDDGKLSVSSFLSVVTATPAEKNRELLSPGTLDTSSSPSRLPELRGSRVMQSSQLSRAGSSSIQGNYSFRTEQQQQQGPTFANSMMNNFNFYSESPSRSTSSRNLRDDAVNYSETSHQLSSFSTTTPEDLLARGDADDAPSANKGSRIPMPFAMPGALSTTPDERRFRPARIGGRSMRGSGPCCGDSSEDDDGALAGWDT